jgi:hypothetical protein
MKKIVLIISVFVLLLILPGCSVERYGIEIKKDAPTVKVKDILLDPFMNGRVVNLEGRIITQCQAVEGCWIFLQDNTGRIFITTRPGGPNDPAPPPFTLPPRTGNRAKITGKIHSTPEGVYLVAQGVEIR